MTPGEGDAGPASAVGGAAGRPVPVVLLHGLTDSSTCWPTVLPRYAGTRPVIALDARGHGGTPLPDEPFTVAALAADAAEALRALDLGPALVVGHSMGGVTAEELALTAPDLVAALVLEDPAWVTSEPEVPGRGPGGRPDWLAPAVADVQGRTVAEVAERGRLDNPRWSEDEVLGWAQAKVRLDPRLPEVPHDWLGRDWVEALADVRVPVTLLTAGPGLGVVTEQQSARAAALLGDRLTHVPFPGVGHNIRREAPAAYLAALDAAVARADTTP